MRSKIFLFPLLTSLTIALTTTACRRSSETPAQEPYEQGFYRVDSPQVPASIRAAAKSVFRVVVPVQAAAEDYDSSLGQGLAERFVLAMFGNPIYAAAVSRQIEACEELQGVLNLQKKKCQVSRGFSTGSGFLAGNGRTLWTAEHVLDGALKISGRPMFFVFDQYGNIVADPVSGTVEQYAFSSKIGRTYEAEMKTDFSALKLSTEIGQPLKVSVTIPNAGERIFAIGFPSCTGCPPEPNAKTRVDWDNGDRSPFPNSNGKDLRVSFGRRIFRGPLPLIHTTVDLVPGNSGGPGLNEKGEVIGIVVATGDRRPPLGVFVSPSELRRLK